MPPKRKTTATSSLVQDRSRYTRRKVRKSSLDTPGFNHIAQHEDQKYAENGINESEDELLLTPSKEHLIPQSPRQNAYLPDVSQKTPRTFMQCVEILVPYKASLNEHISASSSPGPSTPPHSFGPENSPSRSSTTRGCKGKPSLPDASSTSAVTSSPYRTRRHFSHNHSDIHTRLPLNPTSSMNLACDEVQTKDFSHCIEAQKISILEALRKCPQLEEAILQEAEEDTRSTNQIAYDQLDELLKGTILRGEGNSCLLIGPCGSGKTAVSQASVK